MTNGPRPSPEPAGRRRKKAPTKDPEVQPRRTSDVGSLPADLRALVQDIEPFKPPQVDSRNAFYRGVWRRDGTPVLIKEFSATPPDLAAIWRIWGAARSEHIVRLRYTYPPRPGRAAGVANYEVTDYLEDGSLVDVMDGTPIDPDMARSVLRQITEALEYLHRGNPRAEPPLPALTHSDIKPGNILVRSLDPLVLCLTDFGAAQLNKERDEDVQAKMTVPYAAPEATRFLSPAADWWSVGITLLELLQGQHPFALPTTGAMMPDKQIRDDIHTSPVPIGRLVQESWVELIRGLVSYDRDARWSDRQVRDWLEGGHPTIDDRLGPVGRSRRPFQFDGAMFDDPHKLAVAMGQHWDATAKVVVGRELDDLVAWGRTVSNRVAQDLSTATGRLAKSNVDGAIAHVLATLAPEATPMFKGRAVDEAGLQRLTRSNDPADARLLQALRDADVLPSYARSRRYTDLGKIDRTWQAWYTLATTAARYEFESINNLPQHERLASLLLRAVLDDGYRRWLRDQAAQIGDSRTARHSGTLTRLAEAAAGDHAKSAPALHQVMVLATQLSAAPKKPAEGVVQPRTPASGEGKDRTGAFAGIKRWWADPQVRALFQLRRPAERSAVFRQATRALPYLRRRRSTRQRVLLAARVFAVLVGSALLTGVAGLGVAAETSRLQGILIAITLGVSGACLLVAVSLRRSRLTRLLIGAWAGGVFGVAGAFVAGGAVGKVLGPQTGWPVFWTAWAAMVMITISREMAR